MQGMGGNWFGGNWFGGNWVSGSGAGGPPVFASRPDRPLGQKPVAINDKAKFLKRDWDPDLTAIAIMPEFLAVRNLAGQDWSEAVDIAQPEPVTQEAIDELLVLAVTERPEALGEILQEHQNFQICWLQLLNFNGASHPATFFLMKLAARVGEFSMISLKRRFPDRARPSQFCPTLYPPVPVPGHPSYPAGHAIIGQLTSTCLADVVPQPYEEALDLLAARCARNRVLAGLHFWQDVNEGIKIGRQLHEFIKECDLYKTTLEAAVAEWSDPEPPPA